MNPYLSLRLFYLFYFAIIGVLTPYFPVFLKEQGLRASQIGLVMAAWPVAKLVGPIFMSNLADRLNKRLFFIQMGALFCAITYLGFFKASGVWSFLLVMFIFSFFLLCRNFSTSVKGLPSASAKIRSSFAKHSQPVKKLIA